MAVRKQRKMKSLKGRVIRIRDKQHWEQVVYKSGSRLLLVQFTAAWNTTCQKFRPVFQDFSQKFKHVVFAEVDMGAVSEVSDAVGVTQIPTFQAWRDGKFIQEYIGGVPLKVIELIEKHAGSQPSNGKKHALLQRVLTGLLVAGLAIGAGFAGFKHFSEPADSPKRLQSKLQSVESRIQAVQKAKAVAMRKRRTTELAQLRQELLGLTREAEALQTKLWIQTRGSQAGVDDEADEDEEPYLPVQEGVAEGYSDEDY